MGQTSEELKLKLQRMTETSKGDWLQEDSDLLLEDMLDHIGAVDPKLRDELIYSAFAKWIGEGYLSPGQLERVLERCLGLQMSGIGEQGSDTVFTRSFASLALTCVIVADRKSGVLSGAQTEKAIRQSLSYMERERDTRGFVPEKGWAHAIAHGADLLGACVRHPAFRPERAPDILAAVQSAFFKETVYTDDEDSRLTTVIDRLLERGLADAALAGWIQGLPEAYEAFLSSGTDYLAAFHTRIGLAYFLKTLYFRLDGELGEARAAAEEAVRRLQTNRRI
ncbi:DUF2785 domain-containing protein [Paenibacillus humicus]|uniref:DUF2785 domain-containing protein n=1 Tax=Paenibacillus humicus TaxID=412861 RepID=UPI003F17A032